MTSSSSPPLERGLDSMILVYSLLQGHPANLPCEQFLRSFSGWFTSPLVLLETWTILVKVYDVAPAKAHHVVGKIPGGAIALLQLDAATVAAALQLAKGQNLDLNDAVLLQLTHQQGATRLATDDTTLARAATRLGIATDTPIDAVLRQQIAAWENANLAPKGLARVLRRMHAWLNTLYPQAAHDFWSHSGACSHLP